MATVEKSEDQVTLDIKQRLSDYAGVEVYRFNHYAIRIRVVDDRFAGQSVVDREAQIWPLLESLPEQVRDQITLLVLVTNGERRHSLISLEFDDPSRPLL